MEECSISPIDSYVRGDCPVTEELMTAAEVMEYLKISRSTLVRLVNDERLPSYKIAARATRYKRSEVEGLAQREVKS
jgi:excisionase family DNA binding protein